MSTPIESKEGRAVWSSDEEGHKRMIYPEEKQQGLQAYRLREGQQFV
jgi:hypothetical protein